MEAPPSLWLTFLILAAPLASGDAVSELLGRAESGEAVAQLELASIYASGKGVAKDMDAALKWYAKAAEQGNVDAQLKLGGIYIGGRGVRRDSSEAAKWFMMSAEAGNPAAQCQMGRMHMVGAGVAKDDVEAYKWARLAADQKDAAARKVVAFLEKRMTPKQVEFGRQLAKDFLEMKTAEPGSDSELGGPSPEFAEPLPPIELE